jgi:hypothetical protein
MGEEIGSIAVVQSFVQSFNMRLIDWCEDELNSREVSSEASWCSVGRMIIFHWIRY